MGVLALLGSLSKFLEMAVPKFRQLNFENGGAEISEGNSKSAKTPILHTTYIC